MISKKLIGTKPVQVNLRPDLKLKFCLSSMSMITFALLFYLTTSIYKIEQFLGRYGFLNCSEIWLFFNGPPSYNPHTRYGYSLYPVYFQPPPKNYSLKEFSRWHYY